MWGGRKNPYWERGVGRGVYEWGVKAKAAGKKYGWPYAHVYANAGITSDYGRLMAYLASLAKEVLDTAKGFCGNDDSLYSAFQPIDIMMNNTGRSIPHGVTPEQWADPYKNYPEGAPGPLYDWLR